jgi:hypothetical protein
MNFPVGQLQTIDSANWMVLVDTDIPRWGIWVLLDLGFFSVRNNTNTAFFLTESHGWLLKNAEK